MEPVIVPTTDVNSETCIVVEWLVADGEPVRCGQVVVEVETSKSVVEVTAPADGVLNHGAAAGDVVRMGAAVALVFDNDDARQAHLAQRAQAQPAPDGAGGGAPRATRKAARLAAEHGLDLGSISKVGLITVSDVEAALNKPRARRPERLPEPLPETSGVERVLVLGAGLGATQVLDILDGDPGKTAVALLDDDERRWGAAVAGVPVVGGSDRLEELLKDGYVDSAVISISTSITARTRLRLKCEQAGVRLTNAIDRTAKLAAGVRLGQGNVLCAFVHLGVDAQLGDNNFLSAYNSFDHHCIVGSDISTGPGCMASGLVTVGDRVRMGTGIFMQPHVEVGDDVQIASGAVLVQSVPANHSVKMKSVPTVVVPTRR